MINNSAKLEALKTCIIDVLTEELAYYGRESVTLPAGVVARILDLLKTERAAAKGPTPAANPNDATPDETLIKLYFRYDPEQVVLSLALAPDSLQPASSQAPRIWGAYLDDHYVWCSSAPTASGARLLFQTLLEASKDGRVEVRYKRGKE